MRVLLFSDLHAHQFKPYSTVLSNGLNSRFQDVLNILDQIRVIAGAEKVGLILFGGDLFHVRRVINVQTFNFVFEAIARLKLARKGSPGCQLGLLVGNHDQTDRSGGIHSIYAFGAMVEVMDRIKWHTFAVGQDRLNVLAVPYFGNKQEALKQINEAVQSAQLQGPSILLGHFGISGALAGSNFVLVDKELMELEDIKPDQFDQVFLGHYHESQQLAPNVRYIGAPMHHNWGDFGQERGCLIWDTDSNRVDFIPLLYPSFVKMSLDELQHLPNVKVQGDFIRVFCLHGVRPQGEEKVKDDLVNQLGARSVEFIDEAVENQKLAEAGPYQPGTDIETMIQHFVSSNDGDLDPEMLIEAGLDLYRAAVSKEK
jgi:DNA repair exonuclease SbcCD nuclease subunit